MAQNVLIVDDSATIRAMVARIIRVIGLDVGEVYEAEHGLEALACLADHDVGLVVADINMPQMDGIQLLLRMRQDARLQQVPVVIVSTDGSTQRIAQMNELGIAAYVRKPFQPEQLRDALMPILGVVQHAPADHDDAEGPLF